MQRPRKKFNRRLTTSGMILGMFAVYSIAIPQDLQLDAPLETNDVEDVPEDEFGLSAVRDDSRLTADDFKAYYALLNLAQNREEEELAAEARAFVAKRRQATNLPTFVDMIRNPSTYRGKPVQLKGHILQTLTYEADENPYGIEQLYEAALFTDDSQTHPTTIVFTDKPDNLPVGGEMVDGVSVNGYFLKIYWYPSTDRRTRKAPLILAETVHVRSVGGVDEQEDSWTWVMVGLITGAIVLVVIVAVVQRLDRKRMLAEQKRRFDAQTLDLEEASDS